MTLVQAIRPLASIYLEWEHINCQKHILKEFWSMIFFISSDKYTHLKRRKGNNNPSPLNSFNQPKTTPKFMKAIYRKDSTIPLLLHRSSLRLQSNPSIFFNGFFNPKTTGTSKHACLHVPPKNQPNLGKTIVNATNPSSLKSYQSHAHLNLCDFFAGQGVQCL